MSIISSDPYETRSNLPSRCHTRSCPRWLILFSLDLKEVRGIRKRGIDKIGRLLQVLTAFEGWTIASGFASS